MGARLASRTAAHLDDPRVLVVDVLADLRIGGRVHLVDCDDSSDPFVRSPGELISSFALPRANWVRAKLTEDVSEGGKEYVRGR